jgi:hypothetical protein
VAEQRLNDADVGTAFQKMRGEAVPEGVDRHPLAEDSSSTGRATGGMQGRRGQWLVRSAAGEQPPARLHELPITAQDVQQRRREHDIAVLAAPRFREGRLLPASTRMTMRRLSMSPIFKAETTLLRSEQEMQRDNICT